jgi:hypothetical protein
LATVHTLWKCQFRRPKAAKNRVHLDISVEPEELDREVQRAGSGMLCPLEQRLTAAGTGFVEFRSHPGHRWAVMQDPEGNEFCLH